MAQNNFTLLKYVSLIHNWQEHPLPKQHSNLVPFGYGSTLENDHEMALWPRD